MEFIQSLFHLPSGDSTSSSDFITGQFWFIKYHLQCPRNEDSSMEGRRLNAPGIPVSMLFAMGNWCLLSQRGTCPPPPQTLVRNWWEGPPMAKCTEWGRESPRQSCMLTWKCQQHAWKGQGHAWKYQQCFSWCPTPQPAFSGGTTVFPPAPLPVA